MALPSDDDMRAEVAKADSDLQYVLQEAGASLSTMYRVTSVHKTRRRFQAVADTRAEARAAAKDDFSIDVTTAAGRAQAAAIVAAWELAKEYTEKETELRAESKILGRRRVLPVQERQAMLKAVVDTYGKLSEGETPSGDYLAAKAEEVEENEPTASTLDRISSKRDSQVESLQTSLDSTGHVRVTKTMNKLEMPKNSESYRRTIKIEAFAWLAMAARFKAKTWLQGLLLEHFVKFADYILGDKVANLRMPSVSGVDAAFERPPWHVVLSYELKLRTEAFKLVVEEGHRLCDALQAVTQDASLKETYFSTPLALHTASMHQPYKYRKGGNKGGFPGKGKAGHSEVAAPPGLPAGSQRQGKKGKGGKGGTYAGLKLASLTPDGRQICFAYNSQGCKDPSCPRVHVCRVQGCFKEHPASQHTNPQEAK